MSSVSVIIPAHNAAPFIRESVDSALAQTHRDVEVIVVDDKSTDDTPRILQEYGGRITVLHQRNGSAAASRNAGAKIAAGDWLALLDADDVWEPTKLERQLASATATFSYTNRTNFGSRGDVPELQSDVTTMHDGDIFMPLLLYGNFITSSSVLVRRHIFERLGGFSTALKNAEDWDLWLRIAEHHRVTYCPEPLVRYRFHAGGKSRNHRAMAVARRLVVTRAVSSPRGQALNWSTRRRIWGQTWRTNGWDAGQAGARLDALRHYARAAAFWPLQTELFKGALRVCLHG
jgi:teichuronic acid biosynthesis glycosyltransferase TuaG